MPARIDPRTGYVRVTHQGFDKPLTRWENRQRILDMDDEAKQRICDVCNGLIYMGRFDVVKSFFPRERAKTLVKNLYWQWQDFKYRRSATLHEQEKHGKKYILPEMGHKSVQELTRKDTYWIRKRWGDTAMARGVSSTLQAFLTWCVKEGHMEKHIYVPTIKVPRKATPYIELEDRWLIHSKVTPERFKEPLILSIEMGLRIGEVVALKWDAVDLRNGEIRIIRSLSYDKVEDMPKEGDEKTLPMTEKVRDLLAKKDRSSEWVFPAPKGNFIWPNYISSAFKNAAREIGLPQVTLHHCRHSFGKDQESLEDAQYLLGHKSRTTTERYIGRGVRRLNKVEKIRREG